MQERKLLAVKLERDKLQLESEQMDFINRSNRQMAKLLGFSSPERLNAVTKSPFVTLKILFSVFRRVRTLAEYETSGKADLTEEAIPEPPLTARSAQRRRIKPRRRSS
jgi:hypothetical protein